MASLATPTRNRRPIAKKANDTMYGLAARSGGSARKLGASHPLRCSVDQLPQRVRPGSLSAVMNAVVDALSEYGLHYLDTPATPHKVRAAKAAR
jgi:hypothetical protein